MTTPYKDERHCLHCLKDTMHECFDSEHPRDSSVDMQTCLVCGWWGLGMGPEEYDPPQEREPEEEIDKEEEERPPLPFLVPIHSASVLLREGTDLVILKTEVECPFTKSGQPEQTPLQVQFEATAKTGVDYCVRVFGLEPEVINTRKK